MCSNQVEDKNIASPCGHHVEICYACQNSKEKTVLVLVTKRPHPQAESQGHGSDRDTLIIISPTHAPHQMRRNHGHKTHRTNGTFHRRRIIIPNSLLPGPRPHGFIIGVSSPNAIQHDSEDAGSGILRQTRLVGDESHQDGGADSEPGRDVAANVVEGHGIAKDEVFEEDGGELHAGVNGGADGAAEGVPYFVVEPVEEFFGAVLVEVLGRPPVKIGIKLVNHRAVLLNGLKTNDVSIGKKEKCRVDNGTKPDEFHQLI
mmetsp:Transcript_1845/g.3526  ORF Transcript_1845/g.3526 Transcript_1845/m.3526 type:complete len:259 (-) Transcript_1845:274-1050(-)